MKPLITIGVDDLERSLRFYRDGLGFPTDGVVGTEFGPSPTLRPPSRYEGRDGATIRNLTSSTCVSAVVRSPTNSPQR